MNLNSCKVGHQSAARDSIWEGKRALFCSEMTLPSQVAMLFLLFAFLTTGGQQRWEKEITEGKGLTNFPQVDQKTRATVHRSFTALLYTLSQRVHRFLWFKCNLCADDAKFISFLLALLQFQTPPSSYLPTFSAWTSHKHFKLNMSKPEFLIPTPTTSPPKPEFHNSVNDNTKYPETWGSILDSPLPVAVSCGYCNKLPQNWWLKTTEVYLLIVLETRNQKTRYEQGRAPSGGSKGGFFLPALELLATAGVPCGCITKTTATVLTWPFPPLSVSLQCLL